MLTHRPLAALLAAALVALTALAALVVAPTPASAYPGAPWFEPGKPYAGNFPDPSVFVEGGVAYAYGTNTGGSYLPVMRSTDLRTWTARDRWSPGAAVSTDPWFNDALPTPASWALQRPVGGRMTREVLAPGVARIGGRVRAYMTVRVGDGAPGRWCITVASSDSPLGPFRDDSAGPLVCDSDPAGSIDPQPFVDVDGTPYLLWKSEGVPGWGPTRLWSQRLAPDGLSFAAGTSPAELARTSQAWEGDVIENPSMIRAQGRLFLLYSGNEWRSASYAVGFAECASPTGPCMKSGRNPILASGGGRLGPGGASAFVAPDGSLRVAFHSWNAPYTDYPAFPACRDSGTCTSQGQRRLGVERLTVHPDGLAVGDAPPPVMHPYRGSILRLYQAYFLRPADSGGVDHWQRELERGTPLGAVANAFALSAEFQGRYGSLDSRAFVQLVYRNVLDRSPDAGGLAHWTGKLGSSELSRGQVMLGFSESPEFRAKTGI